MQETSPSWHPKRLFNISDKAHKTRQRANKRAKQHKEKRQKRGFEQAERKERRQTEGKTDGPNEDKPREGRIRCKAPKNNDCTQRGNLQEHSEKKSSRIGENKTNQNALRKIPACEYHRSKLCQLTSPQFAMSRSSRTIIIGQVGRPEQKIHRSVCNQECIEIKSCLKPYSS